MSLLGLVMFTEVRDVRLLTIRLDLMFDANQVQTFDRVLIIDQANKDTDGHILSSSGRDVLRCSILFGCDDGPGV